jgi:nucleotide-binding universal stress UspA family protein
MSTILIGVDASARSEDAIAFAHQLAGVSSAHLVVANAFPYNDAIRQGSNPEYRKTLGNQAEHTARDMRDRLEDVDPDRLIVRITANTSPAHALHDVAAAEHAELIVVGSSHTGRIGRVAPGSTGERLLHGAPCAVALVPHGYRTRAEQSIERIGVAYDGSDEASAALAAAVDLARAFSAELEVIGVVAPEIYASSGMMGAPAYPSQQEAIERAVQEGLDAAVAELPEGIKAHSVRLLGDPAEQLGERSSTLDLMIAGSRGYGPIRSVIVGGVSGRLMRTVHCPVIVIPRGVETHFGTLFDAATAGAV